MNKNRMRGGAERGERAKGREGLMTKGSGDVTGGHTVKDSVLTWGDLALHLKG
jgi:hypothetical protein